MFSSTKRAKRSKIKVRFEFVLHDLVLGSANEESSKKKSKKPSGDGKEVAVHWKKGKRTKGASAPALVTNGLANFNGQVMSFESSLIRKDDETHQSFEPKKVAFVLRVSNGMRKKKLGKKVFDLGTIAKDGMNESQNIAFTGNKKAVPSLKATVRCTWLKINGKHITRNAPLRPGKDTVEIDGQEFGLVTGDTVSEADSSHYTGSDDEEDTDFNDKDDKSDEMPESSGNIPVPIRATHKSNSLKDRHHQVEKHESGVASSAPEKKSVIDEWQEKARMEMGLTESADQHKTVESENEKLRKKVKSQKKKIADLRQKYEDTIREKLELKQKLEARDLMAPPKDIVGPRPEVIAESEREIALLKAQIAELKQNKTLNTGEDTQLPKNVVSSAASSGAVSTLMNSPSSEPPKAGTVTDFPVIQTNVPGNRVHVDHMETTVKDMERQLETIRMKKGQKSVKSKEEIALLKKELKEAEKREKALANDMKRVQKEAAKAAENIQQITPSSTSINPHELDDLRRRVKEQEDELKILRMQQESFKRRSDEIRLLDLQHSASDNVSQKAPPLWKETEDRMKAKISRLERQLNEASDSLAAKEREIRDMHDEKQQAELERARAAAALSIGTGSVGLAGGILAGTGGIGGDPHVVYGPGWTSDGSQNILSPYVDAWVRHADPIHSSAKPWWGALTALIAVYLLSAWWF